MKFVKKYGFSVLRLFLLWLITLVMLNLISWITGININSFWGLLEAGGILLVGTVVVTVLMVLLIPVFAGIAAITSYLRALIATGSRQGAIQKIEEEKIARTRQFFSQPQAQTVYGWILNHPRFTAREIYRAGAGLGWSASDIHGVQMRMEEEKLLQAEFPEYPQFTRYDHKVGRDKEWRETHPIQYELTAKGYWFAKELNIPGA